ncbi:MAG: pseudouridine synthase [Desulfovibrio sp.]|jgi:hypothetical protein|nr:pseudouridine synthase [Desulfovibrio sp.]
MDFEIRFRNNDLAPQFPTFQERVNAMLPTQQAKPATAAQTQRASAPGPMDPEDAAQTLAQVEASATQQGEDMLQVHSGLNAQRVARLLGLLE